MVKHIVFWQLADSVEDKKSACMQIKEDLEGLKGVIPGLVDSKVYINMLSDSNVEIALEAVFADANALETYTNHPAHVRIVAQVIQPVRKARFAANFALDE